MRLYRPASVLLGAATAVLLLSAPAWAHVTVNAPGATQGGFSKLTFRVPTEREVPTTKLQIAFPADAPIPFVSVKPHAGWTYSVTKAKAPAGLTAHGEPVDEVVSRITWTATGPGIKAGEFDEFEVSAGPLPETDELVFKALQTYRGGEVVRWIETGEGELEHPAPVLKLAPAASPSPTSSATSSPSPSATPAVTGSDEDEDGDAPLGAIGLGVGVLSLLLAGVALARSRRSAA